MAKDPFVIANTLLCALIALRLMFFRKSGARHCWWASWLAYLLVLGYGGVVINFLFGLYVNAHPVTPLINLLVAALVIRARGNAAKLLSRRI
ncbi:MAG: phage holin family protein [Rouxiella aceris]|uniref:phage holin family protein n=1 Tax=Rouxiella aceris TaxID=2703884 RepID=UPI0028468B24|nr:phage holin family protein [Rouxiella aceris]MDR3431058.1 phage holin family protein [Rouxiella aceris]